MANDAKPSGTDEHPWALAANLGRLLRPPTWLEISIIVFVYFLIVVGVIVHRWSPTDMVFLAWVGPTFRLLIFSLVTCIFFIASVLNPHGESKMRYVLFVVALVSVHFLLPYLVASYVIFGLLVRGNFEGSIPEVALAQTTSTLEWLALVIWELASGLWWAIGLIVLRVCFVICRDVQAFRAFFYQDVDAENPLVFSCLSILTLLITVGVAVVLHAVFRNLLLTALCVAVAFAVFDILLTVGRFIEEKRGIQY